MHNPSLWDFLPFILAGIPVTIEVTVLAMAVALPVAFALGIGRTSNLAAVRAPCAVIVEVFRGSSSVVQLFWAFYVLPFFGINLQPLLAGVLVLGINEGSYFSEVVRAALAAVPKGQSEASLTLGFSPAYRFFRIILPQALPVMIPPFGNALITMLKFTSLVSLVTIQDLSFRANLAATSMGRSSAVFILVMAIYFALSLLLSAGARRLEHWVGNRAGRALLPSLGARRSSIPLWALGRGQ